MAFDAATHLQNLSMHGPASILSEPLRISRFSLGRTLSSYG